MRGHLADFDGPPVRQSSKPPVPCRHPHAQVGRSCFDYCPDCGAVRSGARPGEAAGPWHSCEACSL